MNLQKTILALSLSLSSFVCMGMQPHHNPYAQPVQQYIYFIPVQQYQNLMHIQHQKQLQRQQLEEACLLYKQTVASMQILSYSMQKRAERLTTNTFLQYELQYPSVMPIATKPSKVLARKKQQAI
jgi:hypothetical protein